MPFLSPNQQRQSTQGKLIYIQVNWQTLVSVSTLASKHSWAESSVSKCSFGEVQRRCQQFQSSHVQHNLFNLSLPFTDKYRRARVGWQCHRCSSRRTSGTHHVVDKDRLRKRRAARTCNLDDRCTQITNKLQLQQKFIVFTLPTKQ